MEGLCQYRGICQRYDGCLDDPNCMDYRVFENASGSQVFKSKINKRIHRSEHGHSGDELPKESWMYVD